MVTTIKVLKRKDASSVVVAVVVGLIIAQLLPALVGRLASVLSGVNVAPAGDWQEQYLVPVVNAVLQLLLLEVLLWVWTALMATMKK
ncbi:MAG TPA: hypothetical protein VIK37_03475 [Candidatus Saccharimonadales bacterium]